MRAALETLFCLAIAFVLWTCVWLVFRRRPGAKCWNCGRSPNGPYCCIHCGKSQFSHPGTPSDLEG